MTALQGAVIFLLRQQIPDLHGDLKAQAKAFVEEVKAEAETEQLDNELAHDLAEVMTAGAHGGTDARKTSGRRGKKTEQASAEPAEYGEGQQ